MPDPVIPVVLLSDAPLSPSLKAYLDEVGRETGRYLFFMDLARVRAVDKSIGPLVKARVRADEDRPFIAILVSMKEVSRKRYSAAQHDPMIAHEATHPLIESRGFPALGLEDQPDQAHWAVQSIHNWLADPLVNAYIYERGFNIAPDRIAEIQQSISGLRAGKWVGKPLDGSIRLAVSFLLEPNVPSSLQEAFSSAFVNSLGSESLTHVSALVDIIRNHRIERPAAYRSVATSLADYLNRHLGVTISPLNFAPALRSFDSDQIAKWKAENITSTMKWP